MGDYMVRATAANAQVRAFAVTTKELVETARQAHNTSPVVTAALGRLLTAGVMMGSMLKGDDDLLTLQVRGDGPVRGLTVTANAKGEVRAMRRYRTSSCLRMRRASSTSEGRSAGERSLSSVTLA